jgi:hypothetical protein
MKMGVTAGWFKRMPIRYVTLFLLLQWWSACAAVAGAPRFLANDSTGSSDVVCT